MEQIVERDTRADFLAVYSNTIKRDGAASMLYWLDSKTDFFKAPASRKHHLAQPGGLVIHSLNVYKRLLEITARDVFGGTDGALLAEDTVETVAVLGLLHDVCKVGVYHETPPLVAAIANVEYPIHFRTCSRWATVRKACF